MRPTIAALLVVAVLVACGTAAEPTCDLVIRNGRVVDGSGNPWVYADVGITGERITAVGKLPAGAGKREIDAKGLIVAPSCSDCHRSHDILPKARAESPVHRSRVPATCGQCHEGIRLQFAESAHGTKLAAGNPDAPSCASCHSAHGIASTATGTWQLAAIDQCGTCHREALATYRDTFHGQVTALGFTPVAKCADCHDAHGALGSSDPRSSVAPGNLVTTCRTCHPGANENFVQYRPHASVDDRENLPTLYYASRFMNGLLVATFGFFGLHSILWFVRERSGRRDGLAHQDDSDAAPPTGGGIADTPAANDGDPDA